MKNRYILTYMAMILFDSLKSGFFQLRIFEVKLSIVTYISMPLHVWLSFAELRGK